MERCIRKAQVTDVSAIVNLSEQKRLQYQSYQPVFWKKAEDSREKQGSLAARLCGRADLCDQ